ncbi:MAG TPA: endonuclease/exonuclease/phosphatase family protein [Gemmatimonadales bacterium]|nr:endonuclease/exonuclease/phosphatase family protein [Gemmatimonadales bacterium]
MEHFPLIRRDVAHADQPLVGWRANVGDHVALDLAGPAAPIGRTLVVLSWNVWIGRGDIARVVERIRGGEYAAAGIPGDAPFVALIQEAYRSGDSVPARSNGFMARDFSRRGGHEHDILAAARKLGLNLRYAPSMRNGIARSDRGNAILASLPLADSTATELPFSMQRRVVVSASVTIGTARLRLHSAHLDPRGRGARDLLGFAGRLRQAHELIRMLHAGADESHLLGADLNLARQRAEPAFRALRDAGFATGIPARPITWRHTYHRMPRLLLDWVLLATPKGIDRFEVLRLDEDPRDAGPFVFGSDHHPLVARIDFHA